MLQIPLLAILLLNRLKPCSSFQTSVLPIKTLAATCQTRLRPPSPLTGLFSSPSSSNNNNEEEEEEEESINPNDLETPEERERRMEMVRQIQKSFYGDEAVTEEGQRKLAVKSDKSSTVLQNVPLWRVQWVELPGYQNILNCHVAHYTRKLLLYYSQAVLLYK